MTNDLSGFPAAAQKPLAAQELIALAKTSADPAEIDAAMRAASKNPPFWPADREMTAFFLQAKADPALEDKLLAAAALSASARRDALLESRISDKQGAGTHFIYADVLNAAESKIFKVIRAPQVGSGTGAWGGLKEGEDVDVSITVNREVYEEVIDAVKMLLKAEAGGGAAALEEKFDEALKKSFAEKRPPSTGVADFVAELGAVPALQARVQAFADIANSLIDDLVAADKHKLFLCRDDAHAIDRGWGFKVDAFTHVSGISKETADKFESLRQTIETLKAASVGKGLGTVAGEMQGIAAYTLAAAPKEVKKSFYGHEGFSEIAGFARLLKKEGAAFDPAGLWAGFAQSGAVDVLAAKMHLTPAQLRGVYNDLLADDAGQNGLGGYEVITAKMYAAAHRPENSPVPALK